MFVLRDLESECLRWLTATTTKAKRRIDDTNASNATNTATHSAKRAKIAVAGNVVLFSTRLTNASDVGENTTKPAELADAVGIEFRSTGVAENQLQTSQGSQGLVIETEKMESKKKQRKSSATTFAARPRSQKNKVKKPETLMNMPFDLFYKIVNYLDPRDLLNLSCTSKDLRSVLTSKQTKKIWRAAREALEMPNCPPDLSEMQYANLVFCEYCHSCNAPRIKDVYYGHRIRLCARCRETKLVNRSLFHALFGTIFIRFLRNWWAGGEIPGIHALLLEDEGYLSLDKVQKVWSELQTLTTSRAEHIDLIFARTRKVVDIKNHASELRKWVTEHPIKREKIIEKRNIANQRESMLLEKLKEKGYEDTDFRFCYDSLDLQAKWRRLMRCPRPFTDSLWETIEPKLDALIAERRALHTAYKANYSSDQFFKLL